MISEPALREVSHECGEIAGGEPNSFVSLPPEIRTRNGRFFNPNERRWSWRDSLITVSLDFEVFEEFLSPQLIQGLKTTLVWYAQSLAPDTLVASRSAVLHFVRAIHVAGRPPLEEIRGMDILNYRATLPVANMHNLGRLAGVLKRWRALGSSGVEDALTLLSDMRIAGGLKGQAVLTRCPVNGPFTNIEQEAIQSAVDEAFANGELEEHQYLLTWLLLALGQRPSQYAALKVCDLSQSVSSDGVQSFTLMVPRAKQRNKSRESFTARSLIPQIGLPLWQYAQRVRERFSSQLPDAGQAPMFPEKQLSEHATGFEFHCTTKALSQSFRSALEKLCVFSERTGEPMAITPRRFRRTFGTRLAQEGHGVLQIAELLDHTDTQNVGVYVAATPEIAARIDRAVAMEMAPLAQAFKGILIADESLASRGHNPSSRIRDLRIDRSGKPMGSCGQHSFCGFLAPISCYTCQSFEPWLDGPHEAVLAYLLDRREKGLGNLGDRMVSINDRTILAVAEVIQRCVDIRAEDANAQR